MGGNYALDVGGRLVRKREIGEPTSERGDLGHKIRTIDINVLRSNETSDGVPIASEMQLSTSNSGYKKSAKTSRTRSNANKIDDGQGNLLDK